MAQTLQQLYEQLPNGFHDMHVERDASDAECALPGPLGFQLASESRQRISAGAGAGARNASLDAPFKPPRA